MPLLSNYLQINFMHTDYNHPFLGPGVKENYEFKAVVELTDMLPTATRVLGLKQSPWWRGRVMEEAFDTEAMYPASKVGCDSTSRATHISAKPRIYFITSIVLVSLINFLAP